MRRFKDIRPEQLWLLIGAPITLLFAVLIPPFQVPDEPAHFARAYAVSEGQVTQQNGQSSSGVAVPYALQQIISSSTLQSDREYDYKAQTRTGLTFDTSAKTKIFQEIPNLAEYPPVAYLPQATGIAVARLFTDKILIQFYMARLANAVLLITAFWLVLRFAVSGKWAILSIGLLPMVAFAGGSVSADVMTLAAVAIYTVVLFRIYLLGRTDWKHWLVLAVAALAVALSKQIYIVLLASLIILTLQPGKLKLQPWPILKRRLLIAGTVSVLALGAFGLWQVVNHASSNLVDIQRLAGLNTMPDAQVYRIKHDTSVFRDAVTTTLIGTLPITDIVWSFFGNFGWLDRKIGAGLLLLLAACLLLAFGVVDKNHKKVGRSVSLLFIALSAACVLAVLTGLFVLWTPIDSLIIFGFQGRYLIPLLLFCVPVLVGRYAHTIGPRKIIAFQALVSATCLLGLFLSY